jgi:DNA-directed RNA polymerase subunit RPC12/RpoP
MKKQIKCPNCESYKTRQAFSDSGPESVIGKIIASAGCFLMIPFLLFPPLLILAFVIMGFGAGIANIQHILKGEKVYQCRQCGIKFIVKKG